jgi:starch-binding outer membrane protein, SusD/RagB family
MLNYADCLNETGNEAEAKRMVRLIRQRAGIVVGTNDYGLGNVTGASAVRSLILNERMIEFAFENKRNSDLRRSRTMHTLTGSLQKVEFQLVKSSDKAVLEAPVSPGSTTLFRETIDFSNKAEFNKYFKVAYVNVSGSYAPYGIPEFHYFYTFHNDFVNNGNNILPTVGWAGGVFDPLD